jgi:hypothetical protein
MAVRVALKDVLFALERPEETFAFVDRESGKVRVVTEESWTRAEREERGEDDADADDGLPAWRASELADARRAVADPDRYPMLPDKFDIHEWNIMRRFSESRKNPRHREALMDAIHGSGAFRRFHEQLGRFKIANDWFAFRDEAFRAIAREWLEDEGFEYE